MDAIVRQKKYVAGARFRQPCPAPTTRHSQPGEPRTLRCLTAAEAAIKACSASSNSRSKPFRVRDTRLALPAAARMQGCNAAAQIFKLDFCKSCRAHHRCECLLIRKARNRVRQILVSTLRTAQ